MINLSNREDTPNMLGELSTYWNNSSFIVTALAKPNPNWSQIRLQDYRLWASWSPYDGPKSFLLGRAESISLKRTWSPCTVNAPSSSHCKGPEVHPTLMDLGPSCWEGLSPPQLMGLRELCIVRGPFHCKGLSSSQHNGPDRDIIGILHQRTQVHRSTRDLIWPF